ncbi:hypothetical protein QVD17_05628 [Tagetes erecta]|uniref:Large ribosomal subunit protein uL30m n=1 Tax=Tagetes erecta TaxID=13708 RepID=A0AAD8LE80_TARER|nr:hypothetical protein QVD17_05628 [Tagetes erecta]
MRQVSCFQNHKLYTFKQHSNIGASLYCPNEHQYSNRRRLIPVSKRREMSAFKAYKACVPIAWSPNLYITLVRGIPGTRRLHRRTLEALRLGKCNRTVMRWNTPTVRGMLQQVKRLVVIETEEMFKARKEKEAKHRAIRPPLVVSHLPAPASESSQQAA